MNKFIDSPAQIISKSLKARYLFYILDNIKMF